MSASPTDQAKDGRVAGLVAFVSGGGQQPGVTAGNGRAIAERLASEGARVVVSDRIGARAEDTASAINDAGGTAIAVEADATDSSAVGAVIAQTVERFGRLDILVNNVGIGSLDGGPVSLEESVWDQVQEVNVKSSYLACKHALPQMRLQQSGSIINISSIAALCPHGTLAYSTSKAAVNALTKEVAIGNARHGIRCNAVMPGLIDTPMANDVVADLRGVDRETVSRRRDAQVPLRARQGRASDIANAVLFLASSEAAFITGVILPVDGGQSSRIG